MKKFFAILALALVAFVACTPKEEGGVKGPVFVVNGEWHLVEWNGEAPEFQVYIKFNEGNFDIYQQVYSLYYVNYNGTYSVTDRTLSGLYADGSKWACGYNFSIEKREFKNGDKTYKANALILKSREPNSIESVYESCKIPQAIIDEASETRACEFTPFL